MQFAAFPLALGLLCLSIVSCGEKQSTKVPNTPMKKDHSDSQETSEEYETITLGGGCFWCVEAVYQQLEGVHKAVSGYMGGHVENPTYEQVCSKLTGHVEVVQVQFDPQMLPLEELLEWFWQLHDPTSKDRQGNDVGPQYRSAIFYHTPEQEVIVRASLAEAQKDYDKPIVTEIRSAPVFYEAEDLHQDYYFLNKNKNPYCQAVISPKLKKLKLRH